mgnify:CR=1 FL=1
MKFKVFSFIPLLFLPISIISTEHNFFELEKISIVNYQKNEIENKIIFTAEMQPDETGEDQLPSFSFKRAATQGLTNLEISVLS